MPLESLILGAAALLSRAHKSARAVLVGEAHSLWKTATDYLDGESGPLLAATAPKHVTVLEEITGNLDLRLHQAIAVLQADEAYGVLGQDEGPLHAVNILHFAREELAGVRKCLERASEAFAPIREAA